MPDAAWIAIAGFIVAAGSLVFAALGRKDKATKDYMEQLESRLETVEGDLERCQSTREQVERERDELRSDNYELMRRVIGMPERRSGS